MWFARDLWTVIGYVTSFYYIRKERKCEASRNMRLKIERTRLKTEESDWVSR